MKRSPLFLVDSVRISFKFQHQDGLKFSFEIYNRQVKNSGRVVWKEVFDVNCKIPLQMLLFYCIWLVGRKVNLAEPLKKDIVEECRLLVVVSVDYCTTWMPWPILDVSKPSPGKFTLSSTFETISFFYSKVFILSLTGLLFLSNCNSCECNLFFISGLVIHINLVILKNNLSPSFPWPWHKGRALEISISSKKDLR